MAFCIECGQKIEAGFAFCIECGTEVIPEEEPIPQDTRTFDDYIENTKNCRKCGEAMPADAFYCFSCGESFTQQVPTGQNEPRPYIINQSGVRKNKWMAFFLCLFFGMFGIHKFYEGKAVWGLVYMFSFGLFGFGWIVDIVVLWRKPNPYLVK